METKHTKGNWINAGGDNASCEVNIGDSTCFITRVDKNTGEEVCPREEMEANAKLIAAAPDLLEALIKVREYSKEFGFNGDIYNQVESAIQKATQ